LSIDVSRPAKTVSWPDLSACWIDRVAEGAIRERYAAVVRQEIDGTTMPAFDQSQHVVYRERAGSKDKNGSIAHGIGTEEPWTCDTSFIKAEGVAAGGEYGDIA
jgi:hypothetical protein